MRSYFPDQYTVLVQGASRGLGLALVEQFLKDNRIKKIIACSTKPYESALANLLEKYPNKIDLCKLNLQHEDSINLCCMRIGMLTSELHLVCNVSGFLHDESQLPEKRLSDLTLENLNKSFSVNAFGPMLLLKGLLPLLQGHSHSVIANISARVASIEDNKMGGWYSYRGSKAAQNMLTKNLSIELARDKKYNTVCVALHPGTVDTDLSKPFTKNINPENLLSPEQSSRKLIEIINKLEKKDNGKFYDHNHNELPW